MKKEIWKRLISGLLAFSLMFGLMPPAYAAEAEQPETVQTEVTEETTLATSAPTEPEESSAPAMEPEESSEATDPSTESAGNNSRAVDENAGIATADYQVDPDNAMVFLKDGKSTYTEFIAALKEIDPKFTVTNKTSAPEADSHKVKIGTREIYADQWNGAFEYTHPNYPFTDGSSHTAECQKTKVKFTLGQYTFYEWDTSNLVTSLDFTVYHYYDINVSVEDNTQSGGTVVYKNDSISAGNSKNYDVFLSYTGAEHVLPMEFAVTVPDATECVIYYGATEVGRLYESGSFTLTADMVGSSDTLSFKFLSTGKSVTLLQSDYGSLTIDGYTAEDNVYNFASGTSIVVTPVPNEGCAVFGWYITNESTGATTFIQSSEAQTITVNDDITIRALFEQPGVEEVVAKKKDTDLYYTQSQLKSAIEGASSGETIVLIKNATLNEDVIIKEGVTFLLPYSNVESTWTISTDKNHPNANIEHYSDTRSPTVDGHSMSLPGGDDGETNVILTVADGKTITVEKNAILAVGGRVQSESNGISGQTYGPHSEIYLDGSAQILNDGVVSSVGFITGGAGSKVKVSSTGKLYQPFIIGDYRGGSYTAVAYGKGITPFNQYTMLNVQTDIEIKDGYLYGYADLYTGEKKIIITIPAKHNCTNVSVIGPEDSLITTETGATVLLEYDPDTVVNGSLKKQHGDKIGRTTISIDGGASFETMSLTVKVVTEISVNTESVVFPLPYNYRMNLSGGSYDLNASFKILPGAEVYVEQDATVNVNQTLQVYDGFVFLEYGGGVYPTAAQLADAGLSEAATLVMDGTLNLQSNSVFAGVVQTSGNTGKIVVSTDQLSSELREGVLSTDEYSAGVDVDATSRTYKTVSAQIWDKASNQMINMVSGSTYYAVDGSTTYIDVNGKTAEKVLTATPYNTESATNVAFSYQNAPVLKGTWCIPSLTFISNNENVANYGPANYEAGTVTIPNVQKDGYDFTGWYTEDGEAGTLVYGAEQAGTQVTMPCDNLTLYAHFAPKQYTVTFEENGGTDVADISGLYGSSVTDFPTTTRAGYTFDGWYNNIEFSGEPCTSITMPLNGTTLYAKWTAIEYNITWVVVEDDAYPVTGAPAAIDNPVTFDTSIALPTTNDSFFRTGYDLIGWSLSVDGAAKKGTVTLSELNNGVELEAGEVLLYAIWEPVVYTVHLNPNGGELEDTYWQNKDEDNWNVRSYTVESPITLPTAVKNGYALEWVSGETVLSPGAKISTPDQQGKYTAIWTPIAYKIELNADGGTLSNWTTNGYSIESSDIILPVPEKPGYEFKGWVNDAGETVAVISAGSTGDVKLTASWLAESYTIELDPGVGTLPDGWSDKTYTIESDDIILPVLSQDGYDFKGWIDTDGNVYDKILAGSHGNLKLEADWEIIPYSITLNTDGGSVNNWDNYTYYVNSGEIILPAGDQIIKEGNTFVGWTDEEGNEATSIPTGSFGDRSFKAIWTINEYTVDFVTYCEAQVNPITAEFGKEISAPDAITREGYTFEGWYDNAAFDGEKFVFSTMPAKNVTLYAKWNTIEYEIQLHLNDGTLPEGVSETIPYTIESQVTLPVPSKYGYDFDGWYDNEELNGEEIQSGYMPIDGLNLYAKWEPKSISVTLNADGGSFSDGQTTMQTSVFFGKMYRTQGLQTPTRTGYRFDYWMLDGVEATDLSVNREEAHELVAHWTAKEYDVVFNAGDGLINDTQNSVTIRVAFNSVLGQLPTATREGYDFMGWYDGDQKITVDTVLKTEGAEYEALWAAQTYSIMLDYGYDVPNGTAQVTFGKEYSEGITSPSRTGYAFDAWYLDEDCTKPLKLNDAVTLDYPGTLYANWTALEFDITYRNVDGVTELRRGFNSAELPITLAHPEKTGYTFTGWTVDGEEGLILDYTIEIGVAQDLTLTANWDVNQYTLTFVTGSDSVIEPVKGDYGAAFTVALPEKNGYNFAGWNPELPATIPSQDTEYVAQWAPISYQVQYDLSGGQWNTGVNAPEGNVNYETQITLPEQQACVKTGYLLDGWKVEDTDVLLEAPVSGLTAVEGTVVTLVAQWSPIRYHVAYDQNVPFDDASVEHMPLTQTGIKYDEMLTLGGAPSLAGYTFQGWSLSKNGEAVYEAGAEVSNLTNSNDVRVILYAVWQMDTYTITYSGMQDIVNTDSYPEQYNVHTESYTLVNPSKIGYSFIGWNEEGNTNVTIGGGQTGDLEFTALWKANTYQVTFTGNGATMGEDLAETWIYAQEHKLPENIFEKTGYHFTGWLVDNEMLQPGTVVEDLAAQQDAQVEISAQWAPNVYTVIFEGNGADADSNMAAQTITFDETTALNINTFLRTGYTFTGWNTAADGKGTAYAQQADVINLAQQGEFTLYAQWKINQYTITFANTGDTEMEAITADYGSAIGDVEDPIKLGYDFLGWDKEIPDTMPAEDMTITAFWEKASFTLTLNYDNGAEPTVQTWIYQQSLVKPEDPTREGYTFGGWFTEVNGQGTRYYVLGTTDTMPAQNLELVAYWIPRAYTITFIENGGSQVSDITQDFGSLISAGSIPAPEKTGYSFVGWYENADLSGEAYTFTTMPLNGKTLYAKWDPNSYTVVFHRNVNAEDETLTQDLIYDAVTALAMNSFEREGYSFSGWNTSTDGNGTAYADGEMVSKLATQGQIILYAQWKINSYTVTLNIGDGYVSGANGWKHPEDQSEKPVLVTYTTDFGNRLPTLMPTFNYAGFRFDGWLLDGSEAALPATMPAQNTAYEAKYTSYLELLLAVDVAEDLVTARQYYALLNDAQREEYLNEEAHRTHKDRFFFEIERQGLQNLRAYVVNAQEPTNEILAAAKDLEDETITYKVAEMTVTDEKDQNGMFISDPPILEGMVTKPDYKALGMLNIEFLTKLFGYGQDTNGFEEITHVKAGEKDWIELTGRTGLEGDQFNIMFHIAWEALGPNMSYQEFFDWLYGQMNEITIGHLDGVFMPVQAKVTTDEQIGVDENGNPVYFSYIQEYHLSFFNQAHQVFFDTQGGEDITAVELDYQDVLSTLPEAVRPGYTFLGWYDGAAEDSAKVESITMGKTDATLYAKWSLNNYTISLNLEGGELQAADQNHWTENQASYTVLNNDAIVLPAPVRTGYTFEGWYEVLENGTLAQEATASLIPSETLADKTYQAKWTVNAYTITFNTDGGSQMEPVKLDYGEEVAVSQIPEKLGYTFIGWQPALPETMPADDLEVTAQWTKDKYTITYEGLFDWSNVNLVSYDVDSEFALINPVREGYTFTGWTGSNGNEPQTQVSVEKGTTGNLRYTANWTVNSYTITLMDGEAVYKTITQNYGTAVDAVADPVKTGYSFGGWSETIPETMPAKNMTLNAKWIAKTFQVTLDANEGTVDPGQITVTYDGTYSALPTPSRENYGFMGWYTALENGQIVNAQDVVKLSGDITLYALWKAGAYTISYDLDGGNATGNNPNSYTVESSGITLSNPTKTGYTFHGWSGTGIDDLSMNVVIPAGSSGDRSYKANWQINQYTITFADTGDSAVDAITADYASVITKPADPVKEGYTFVGWEPAVPETMPAADMTLTAQWTVNQYTITFQDHDGRILGAVSGDYGTAVKAVNDPQRTGYTFTGWEPAVPETMPAGDMTLTAQYAINSYTITLMDGEEVHKTITQNYGSAISAVENPSKVGYTFAGWDKTIPETMPAQNMTINAKWTINRWTVTYLDHDGTVLGYRVLEYGAAMETVADPSREGHDFTGWAPALPETMPDHDLNVTAQYAARTYIIKYYDSPEDTTADTLAFVYGAPIVLEQPVREGYIFNGWKVSGSIGLYEALPATMPADDLMVCALWTTEQFDLIFVLDGEEYESVKVGFGEVPGTVAEPVKTGYTFSGWSALPETMPAQTVYITGSFQANVYTVEFDPNGNAEGQTDSNTFTYDEEAALNSNAFTRTGYTFTGWNTAADASADAYSDGETVKNLTDVNGARIKLYAIWQANTYTVTLVYGDGVTENSTITVTYDGTYENLPTPEREGYTFAGWSDGTNLYTASTPVKLTQDLTLTAQWNAKGDTPYTVKRYLQNLDESGYTLVGTEGFTGATGAMVQAAAQQFTGFWLNPDKSTQSGVIAADGSLVLELYYDRNVYTVTWHVCDTYVSEEYLYEQIPAYTGQKDYADLNASYTFTGWDAEPVKVTDNVTYSAQYERHYQASFFDANGEITITYAYLADALAAAKNGQTVRLEEDVTLTENLTVPAGVNLLLPYSEKDTGYIMRNSGKLPFNPDGTSTAGHVGVGPNAKLHRSLTVPADITLSVFGNVMVNAVTGRPSAGNYDHDVTGGYSQINLEGNIVVENGGNLDCFGYVKGSGLVTARSGGGIGDLYIVRHWRGGSWALKMYEQGMIYPMNEYDCHNIETAIRVEYGGSYDGLVKMYASGEYHYTRFPQVNVNNGLIRLHQGGYVIRSYADGKDTYTIYGGADFAESTLNIVGMNLTTSAFLYPIDGDYAFELYDGDYRFANDFKFLTGADMIVHDGADLTVDEGVTLVFYDVFKDTSTDGTRYPEREKALLTIEAGGSFTNMGTFGGSIYTESAEILVSGDPVWGGWTDGVKSTEVITKEADKAANGIMSVEHDLFITRPNYSWRYGREDLDEHPKSIIWLGADYTELMKALQTVPKDLSIYSDETGNAVRNAVDQVIFDLGVDRQDDVDAWTDAINTAVKNLTLRIVKVTFDAKGGSVQPAFIEITYGQVYGTLPEPDHYGFIFDGWFTQYNDPITEDTVMDEVADHTLYAAYTMIPADYTQVDEAIASIPASMNGYTAESVQAVQAAKDAVVRGLGKAEQTRVDAMAQAIADAVKNLTLVTVTVTFDANGGETSGKSFEATYSKPYGELPEATREGFEFLGWYTAKEGGQRVTAQTLVTSVTDLTLFAKWSNAASTEPGDYTAVDKAIASIPENLEGYTSESVENLELAVQAVERGLTIDRQADIDAWAKAIEQAIADLQFKTVTVYFDANGGQCDEVKRQITYGGKCDALPEATREYSAFLGWFTEPEGGVAVTGDELTTLTQDVTLYAQYELLNADYTELNKVVESIPEDLSCYSDETVEAMDAVLKEIDYTFTADRQSRVDEWTEQLRQAIENLSYRFVTLTYDAQGGTVDPRNVSVQYHSPIGKLPTPKKEYYVFDAWYTEPEGGEKITAQTIVDSVVDFTVYARWIQVDADYTNVEKAKAEIPADWQNGSYTEDSVEALQLALDAVEYGLNAQYQKQIDQWASAIRKAARNLVRIKVDVTYRNDGRTVRIATITYGKTYGSMPEVTRQDDQFLGWFTEEQGGERITSDTLMVMLEDHTLYAHWLSDSVEEPSEPTEPSEPSEPTEPSEPSEPTEPSEPSEPTEPSEPSEPTEPSEPSEPTEPSEPSEPTEPSEPSEPSEPTEPSEPSEPTEPSKPTEPEEIDVYVTLDAGEGEVEQTQLIVFYGKPYGELPEPERRYHVFQGWYTEEEGGAKVTEETFVVQISDHTLYARWEYRPMPFEDVSEGRYYYDPIYDLYYEGLVNGISTEPPLYGPNMSTTRGQMITMIYRLMGAPEVSGTSPFVDVKSGKFYEKAVIWGAQNGIIKGVSETEFAPDQEITREQFAAMLFRLYCENYGDVTPSADLSQFPDRDKISNYARDAITWAVQVGIINGKGGMLEAKGLASRAEVATMLQRYMLLVGLLK